jgi:hypothetical protein
MCREEPRGLYSSRFHPDSEVQVDDPQTNVLGRLLILGGVRCAEQSLIRVYVRLACLRSAQRDQNGESIQEANGVLDVDVGRIRGGVAGRALFVGIFRRLWLRRRGDRRNCS